MDHISVQSAVGATRQAFFLNIECSQMGAAVKKVKHAKWRPEGKAEIEGLVLSGIVDIRIFEQMFEAWLDAKVKFVVVESPLVAGSPSRKGRVLYSNMATLPVGEVVEWV